MEPLSPKASLALAGGNADSDPVIRQPSQAEAGDGERLCGHDPFALEGNEEIADYNG